jgi:hypothetical protein
MFGNAVVKNSPAPMLDDKKNKQYSQANRGHCEKVDGDDLREMILQKCPPTLGRRSLYGLQYSRNAPFGDYDSKLQ